MTRRLFLFGGVVVEILNAGYGPSRVWLYWTDDARSGARPDYLNACLGSVIKNCQAEVAVCDADDAFMLLPELPDHFVPSSPTRSPETSVGVASRSATRSVSCRHEA